MFLEQYYLIKFLTKKNLCEFLFIFFYFNGSVNKKYNAIYISFSFNNKTLLPIFFFLTYHYNLGFLYKKSTQLLFQIFSKKEIAEFSEKVQKNIFNLNFPIETLDLKKYFIENTSIFNNKIFSEKIFLFYFFNEFNITLIEKQNVLNFHLNICYYNKNKKKLLYLHNLFFKYFNISCSIYNNKLSYSLVIKSQSSIYYYLLLKYNFYLKFFNLKKKLIKYYIYMFIIKKYNLNLNNDYEKLFFKLNWYFLFNYKK